LSLWRIFGNLAVTSADTKQPPNRRAESVGHGHDGCSPLYRPSPDRTHHRPDRARHGMGAELQPWAEAKGQPRPAELTDPTATAAAAPHPRAAVVVWGQPPDGGAEASWGTGDRHMTGAQESAAVPPRRPSHPPPNPARRLPARWPAPAPADGASLRTRSYSIPPPRGVLVKHPFPPPGIP